MSFILDALKKSESERQQQAGAEFSDIPTSPGEPQSFKWLWILAVILLVNLVVLLAILLRPEPASKPAAPVEPPNATQEQPQTMQDRAPEPSFEEQVAAAKRSQPATAQTSNEPDPAAAASIEQTNQPDSRAAEAIAMLENGRPTQQPATDGPSMKTFDELRLEGALQLVDLHIDIHVYAEEPAERFVFINMNKHTENSTLAEGPVVKEITTDGVVLEHQGNTFLLPRE
jgi:general secretion pathway protein B